MSVKGRQHQSTQSQQAEKWEPNAEEMAEIHARDMPEVNDELALKPHARRERTSTNIE
ncbi:hypothetical protein [Mycoavidus sp. B2-EB]|uniref:hypothetical protein n=1 Tax=Mycoavidus sp. B2-EB TaxID=2651972 RepID=UPI0016281D25|nr:hypothetical protein [Mycoavidus sp. B2-EB]